MLGIQPPQQAEHGPKMRRGKKALETCQAPSFAPRTRATTPGCKGLTSMTLWANGSMHCAASARPPPRTFAGHAAAAWIRGIRRPVAARAIDPTLEGLRSALDQAVATEDYASAARLRDAILVADPEAHATALIAELRDRLGEAVAGERFLVRPAWPALHVQPPPPPAGCRRARPPAAHSCPILNTGAVPAGGGRAA